MQNNVFIASERRPFLLLEVMIAFLLIALCLLPLLKPHYAMIQSDREILEETKIEHVVQKLYADFLVKLYRGEIHWSDVGHFDAPVGPVDIPKLQLEELPYTASYVLRITPKKGKAGQEIKGELSKPNSKDIPREEKEHHLFEITYTFVPNNRSSSNKDKKFVFRLYVHKPKNSPAL